ncbi:hypothetical protein ccbrp13_06500 [Ktedonobacteria bacterium brp13]|nr:hypothetical protein ccbrp13_06500 [Ktedonobacteria bacterium brp13]
MQESESLFHDTDQQPDKWRDKHVDENKYAHVRAEPTLPYASPVVSGEQHGRDEYTDYTIGYGGMYDGLSERQYEQPWPYRADGEKLRPREQQPLSRRRSSFLPMAVIGVFVAIMLFFTAGSYLTYHSMGRMMPFSQRYGGYLKPVAVPYRQQDFKVGLQPRIIINVDAANVNVSTGGVGNVAISGNNDLVKSLQHAQSGSTLTFATSNKSVLNYDSNETLNVVVPATSDVVVQDATGATTITGINGSVSVNSNSGDIATNNVSGQVVLNTTNGNIDAEVTHLGGGSKLSSATGNVTFSGGPDGDSQISTGSGNVIVSIMPGVNIEASTVSGSIDDPSALDHSTGPTLHVHTTSGHITVGRG